MAPDSAKERRRFPRVKSAIALEVRYRGAVAPLRAMTSEVSLSGCYVETMFTLDIGTAIEIVMWLDGEKITAKGVIATKYPQVGNGIDIKEMTPEGRSKLEAFLKTQELPTPKF